MKGKLLLAAGVAAGYVFGARAGRERYDQISAKARGVWGDPRVQEKVTEVEDAARAKAPEVQQKVTDAARSAASAVAAKTPGGGSEGSDTASAGSNAQGRPAGGGPNG